MSRPPFTSKECPGCQVDKPRSEYYKKGSTVSHKCKICSLADAHKNQAKYIGKYREYQNEWRNNKFTSDEQYRKKIRAQRKEYRERTKDIQNAKRRDRWANVPDCSAKLYYRRKDVKDKTPKWVCKKQLLAIYAACPKGFEVDHIIPLRGVIDGRPVSGLHVPWNLQYLTFSENRKKKNRITESDITHDSIKR